MKRACVSPRESGCTLTPVLSTACAGTGAGGPELAGPSEDHSRDSSARASATIDTTTPPDSSTGWCVARCLRRFLRTDRLETPNQTIAAVRSEDAWFWSANDDWKSKRSFSSILFPFTLPDANRADRLSVITITVR